MNEKDLSYLLGNDESRALILSLDEFLEEVEKMDISCQPLNNPTISMLIAAIKKDINILYSVVPDLTIDAGIGKS
jgi:hypothetical protein